MKGARAAAWGAWVAAALAVGGCFSEDRRVWEVELVGTIAASEGLAGAGAVHVEVHHARSGEGQLGHPLGLVAAFEVDGPGEVREVVEVPIEEGDGLVIYAWLDGDGDGILCAPGAAPEPAGALEVIEFPSHEVSFALVLDAACAGAEALYP